MINEIARKYTSLLRQAKTAAGDGGTSIVTPGTPRAIGPVSAADRLHP